jgi:hypothetical protein
VLITAMMIDDDNDNDERGYRIQGVKKCAAASISLVRACLRRPTKMPPEASALTRTIAGCDR